MEVNQEPAPVCYDCGEPIDTEEVKHWRAELAAHGEEPPMASDWLCPHHSELAMKRLEAWIEPLARAYLALHPEK